MLQDGIAEGNSPNNRALNKLRAVYRGEDGPGRRQMDQGRRGRFPGIEVLITPDFETRYLHRCKCPQSHPHMVSVWLCWESKQKPVSHALKGASSRGQSIDQSQPLPSRPPFRVMSFTRVRHCPCLVGPPHQL